MFHPVGDDGPALVQIAAAKAVCRRCPVTSECLSFALVTLPEGVVGGLTAGERAELRCQRGVTIPADVGVDELVVAQLVAGERMPGASRRELERAGIELHQAGHGPRGIAGRLGVGERQVARWLQRHRAETPVTADRRVGRVSA